MISFESCLIHLQSNFLDVPGSRVIVPCLSNLYFLKQNGLNVFVRVLMPKAGFQNSLSSKLESCGDGGSTVRFLFPMRRQLVPVMYEAH